MTNYEKLKILENCKSETPSSFVSLMIPAKQELCI